MTSIYTCKHFYKTLAVRLLNIEKSILNRSIYYWKENRWNEMKGRVKGETGEKTENSSMK